MPDAPEVPPQSCPACGTAVNVAEAEPLARITCPNCGEKFRVERAFDNFQLVETLGAGGMGWVYKARDTRLDRFVALKLLRKELSADPAEAARLEQEARVTAAVNHPNVVQVYSAGSAHGQIYLVMELVDHGSLDDLMAQHTRVPEARVLLAGIQVAKGLQAAQKKGLIHRDVKPANILYADANTAKIGDFGLAGMAEQHGQKRSEIWGTPYYVAPERLNDEPEDFRSDIYSLGATLFHALAGKPPIEGDTTSAAELRQLKAHPPDLAAAVPDVSRETTRIINRMLAPRPENRFTSYAHVVDQLSRAYREVAAGTAAAPSRSRAMWIGVGVVALSLAIGGGVYIKKKTKAPVAAAAQAQSATSATPDNTAAVQKHYDEARQQLISGNVDEAAKAFTRLATEVGSRQPLLNWIRLHAGLAAILQGNAGPARDIFQQIAGAPPFSTAKADADLAKFFIDTATTLATPLPVRSGSLPEPPPKNVNAFALLFYGIKDWQLREFDEGATLLDRFNKSESPNEFKWIDEYKPMAAKYLEDRQVYIEWKALPSRFKNPAEAKAAAEKVSELHKRVQTRGALADALKDDEKRLNNRVATLEKSEAEKQEKANKELLGKETPLWEAARAEAQTKIAAYDFTGALAVIDAARLTEPSLKEAQAAERKKTAWLVEWKTRLIADLKTGAFKGAVTVGPTTYQGAASATENEITLRIGAYGGAPLRWDKFSPPTLLAMSSSFIRPNTADAADRQWLSAVFANATGQADAGKSLAEAAASAKPEYRDQIKLLTSP